MASIWVEKKEHVAPVPAGVSEQAAVRVRQVPPHIMKR
jgi:hypothetical protein